MHPLVVKYLLPALGAVLALWGAYDWAHDRAVAEERGKWVVQAAKDAAAAHAKSNGLQSQVDAAGVALSASSAEIERLATLAAMKRSEFYVQNTAAAGPCLHIDRLRAIQAGDDAANAAITAR